MQVQVKWLGKMAFQGTTPEGHNITMDASPDHGGENQGPRPTELVLQAVAGCSGIDIVDILTKMRLKLTSLEMEVTGERANESPRYFTKVKVHYKLAGEGLTPEKVERAITLSLEKYCSVSQSLRSEISWSYTLVDS